MDYEMAMMYENGEMSNDCYRIAHDDRGLAAIIEELRDGHTILKDARRGCGFCFGQTAGGRWYFATDEFLDADEERENPDFHEGRYDAAIEGVRDFKVNGKPLIEVVRGCRMMRNDAPDLYPDKPE